MESKFKAIKDIILRNISDNGNYPTLIKGVNFAKRNAPSEFVKCFYKPACILVLQGKKQMIYGNDSFTYGKGQYVVSCTNIPVSARILEASSKEPFLCILLEFDSNLISNLILEARPENSFEEERCLGIAKTDEDLLDAFYRLVRLIEKPANERDMLSSLIIKEIYYRLLTGPLGAKLCLINTKGTRFNQIARAIEYLEEKFSEKISIDEIARHVNMAPSSFYRNFRKVTRISPLQYQKQLRLNEAQRLLLSGKYNAENVSYAVGYESPTQFSREYKKMFGNPPKADIKKLITV